MAINAISANMDSFARGRTAILKKQPSHMEAAHFGDLGMSFDIFFHMLIIVVNNNSLILRPRIDYVG